MKNNEKKNRKRPKKDQKKLGITHLAPKDRILILVPFPSQAKMSLHFQKNQCIMKMKLY
jgi:hypothetical protein